MTLKHLDTVLAFVLIMTGVGLLVTTLTQMASAALGLRGTNLRWGIETFLNELDPNLRSEEHTSELQSRFDLVCRLLLEKKKNNYKCIPPLEDKHNLSYNFSDFLSINLNLAVYTS